MTNKRSRNIQHGKPKFNGRIVWLKLETTITWSGDTWNPERGRIERLTEKAVFGHGN
jgi:hypothetical protein